jgi:C1A family cysteine protease
MRRAFSTTGSVEGAQFIKNKILKSLSEQQLVDCSGSFGNEGCNGGLYDDAYKYIIQNGGSCAEASYPYTGADGTCKKSCTPVTKISSYHDVTPNSDAALAAAVTQQPTSISIEADQSAFQFYSSGVLTAACGTNIDHAVLAVGFGTDAGVAYWKVKNSWGASWGMSGYILLARGESYNGGEGQCGLYNSPAYPIV